MKEEYLRGLTFKIAHSIFGEVVEIFNYSHNYEIIKEMKEYADSIAETRGYNEKEITLIKDHLRKIFQEYRSECQYHDLCYR